MTYAEGGITPPYYPEYNLPAEHLKAREKLSELKRNSLRIVVADYDGTVYDRHDPSHGHGEVVDLCFEIANAGVDMALISARHTTLEYELMTRIRRACRERQQPLTIYRSGGNGMNLTRATYASEGALVAEDLYRCDMTKEDIQRTLEAYLRLGISNPDPKSQAFFAGFLRLDDLSQLIPAEYVELAKPYEGQVFIERAKASYVLPTTELEQRACITRLRAELEPHGLNVGWGNAPFADISKKMDVDGKLLAGNILLQKTGIDSSQAGFFGDAPHGNDSGLLTFPYSFTNYQKPPKIILDTPPYILPNTGSPVGAIHQAIRYLIH